MSSSSKLTGNGILHNAGISGGPNVYLPLEELRASAVILDVSARVTLSQVYSNPSPHPTSRAVYFFPVPYNAAVCGFEMRTSDGRILKGVAKETELARVEFEEAIQRGQGASLLSWVSDDVFTIAIGSIPANETVETRLTYVMTLMNDDSVDEIRFHLPLCVGQRYGDVPPDLVAAQQPSSHSRLRITVDVQTTGRIESISSPSHNGHISETRYPTHLGRPSRRRTTVKFCSSKFLERDFVLIVKARGLDAPRCFAELEHDGQDSTTLAMQLVVIPRFGLPRLSHQEYLFVVDRSGSMGQDRRIEVARNTLAVLLKMLPTEGTVFNIFCFGSTVESLWTASQDYNANTLSRAIAYAESMDSSLGGTEIGEAHRKVLSSRMTNMPTAIFVLTDGEVEPGECEATIKLITGAVSSAYVEAPLRVYSLGIGDQVSTSLCEGIAEAGHGVCLFALSSESIVSKCVRLFRAGRTAVVKDIEIDWGFPDDYSQTSSPSVNFSGHSPVQVSLRPPPTIQQAPHHVQAVYAGMRLMVFVIVKLRRLHVPRQVVLRGRVQDSGDVFELKVPVHNVQLSDSEMQVHTLTALHLIREHNGEKAPVPLSFGPAEESEKRKAAIIRLGERYQLASRFTSFVLIDAERRRESTKARTNFGNWRTSSPSTSSQRLRSSNDPIPDSEKVPGAWPSSSTHAYSSLVEEGSDGEDIEDSDGEQSSGGSFTTLSTLESYDSEWSEWSVPVLTEEDLMIQQSPIPSLDFRLTTTDDHRPPQGVDHNLPEVLVNTEVLKLIKLQSFDGSFSLNAVRQFVGNLAALPGVDQDVWATVIAVAYISKRQGQTELLDDLISKAKEFLGDKGDLHELLVRASQLV